MLTPETAEAGGAGRRPILSIHGVEHSWTSMLPALRHPDVIPATGRDRAWSPWSVSLGQGEPSLVIKS
jgi:hypothetical protein